MHYRFSILTTRYQRNSAKNSQCPPLFPLTYTRAVLNNSTRAVCWLKKLLWLASADSPSGGWGGDEGGSGLKYNRFWLKIKYSTTIINYLMGSPTTQPIWRFFSNQRSELKGNPHQRYFSLCYSIWKLPLFQQPGTDSPDKSAFFYQFGG